MDPNKEFVIETASRLMGDFARATHWFEAQSLREFNGATAADLVKQGRAQDVLKLLEMMEAGPAG